MEKIDPKAFDLVEDRVTFFKDRVNAYALKKDLNSQQVVDHLQQLAREHGEKAITGIIDEVVPGYLHSSRAPKIKEVEG
ncbi:MAG TPA: hypothetical protein VGB63_13185 [Pedobacter sp.]|jgi:hypothetical protein